RKCDDPSCQGILRDTIINFGEDLPDSELTRGTEEGEVADLCLAMGSSLTVTPAADIPECVTERGEKLVIVNLQKTPLHNMAALCIHAKCEEVSTMVMEKLGLPIPEFRLKRRVFIKVTQSTKGPPEEQVSLSIEGQDMYGFYFSFLTGVTVFVGERPQQLQEPFSIRFPWRASAGASSDEMKAQLTFHFQGHYGEPPLDKELIIKKGVKDMQLKLLLIYNPGTSQWSIEDDTTAGIVPTAGIKKLTLKDK
uniref:Regulatory protein SIR2 homolog 7 n=2 Tax=Amphimedon queenslandica TaxID=400682 RepID=A0A1X7STS1_AMPQE